VSETSDRVTVDRTMLQIVFDVAVNSLDFGSGFLDDEEVTGLRAIAESLGVDPMVATPEKFRCKYAGQHELLKDTTLCRFCQRELFPRQPHTPPLEMKPCDKFRP